MLSNSGGLDVRHPKKEEEHLLLWDRCPFLVVVDNEEVVN